MFLIVLAVWLGLSVVTAVFVAALGRSALHEDEALGHVPAPPRPADGPPPKVQREPEHHDGRLSGHGRTPIARNLSTTS